MNLISQSLKTLTLACLSLSILSCEKEVNLALPTTETQKLVVEGSIEINQPPLVYLTTSFGFFNKIDAELLANTFVHDAKIKVTDGSDTVDLIEFEFPIGDNKIYFYSVDTANAQAMNFRGKAETFYTLLIQTGDKAYSAVTKIPNQIMLDSIWSEPANPAPEATPDASLVFIKYNDPDTIGNAVRIFTQVNSEPTYPALGSVYNDEIINGTPIKIGVARGMSSNSTYNRDSTGYFFKGDTVTIKWSTIDQGVYKFWSTFSFAQNSTGNPFSSPINVQTNISGGALGVWAGYGSTTITHIIPK